MRITVIVDSFVRLRAWSLEAFNFGYRHFFLEYRICSCLSESTEDASALSSFVFFAGESLAKRIGFFKMFL